MSDDDAWQLTPEQIEQWRNEVGDEDEPDSPKAKCQCRQCLRDRDERHPDLPMLPAETSRMIVCEWCENKRCPHATDHRLECSGSNEPGQKGTVYE